MKKWFFWLGCLMLVTAFSGGEEKLTPLQYIETYKHIAVSEMHRTGIPASITMAQGLLESGNGNSRLARQGNNHFGIKCKSTWTGKTIYEDDDAPGECFRAYDSAYLSYIDHSEFLLGNRRYAFLFEYSRTDYKSWAEGLKKAGYATNPKYPTLLITIIERHELYKLDLLRPEDLNKPEIIVKTDSVTPIPSGIVEINRIPATHVQPGDQVDDLAKRNEMGAWQIRRYNDLPKGQELKPGEIIYLKPKKRKGSAPYHVVQPGETMWSISQMYGIKLKHLYRKNHLDRKEGEQPQPGQTLFLQEKSPEPLPQPEEVKKPEVAPELPEPIQDTATAPKKVEPQEIIESPTPEIKETPPVEVKPSPQPEEKYDGSETIELHTVQAGETLFSIAKRYQLSVEQLRELNGLTDFTIHIGQELIINKKAKEEHPDTETTLFVHTVKSGETLFSIAKKYNMSVEALKALNQLESNELKIGQKLNLNQNGGMKKEVPTNELPSTHKVEAGDTLYSLSRKYQISIEQLKELNGLVSNALSIGQVLKLR